MGVLILILYYVRGQCVLVTQMYSKHTCEKTEEEIKNGQPRDTGNIGHNTQNAKKTHTQHKN